MLFKNMEEFIMTLSNYSLPLIAILHLYQANQLLKQMTQEILMIKSKFMRILQNLMIFKYPKLTFKIYFKL